MYIEQDLISKTTDEAPRIALYCEDLRVGGAQQKARRLCEMFLESGYRVDLVVNEAGGQYESSVPANIRVFPLVAESRIGVRRILAAVLRSRPILAFRSRFISLNRLGWLVYVPSLAEYLEKNKPDILISNLWSLALTSSCARLRARCATRLICIFRSAFFSEALERRSMHRHPLQWAQFFHLCRTLYSEADSLVTISKGVARDLTKVVGVQPAVVRVLPNPVIGPELSSRMSVPLQHEWLERNDRPLLLAVGRLSPEKNYCLLLRAMAKVKFRRAVRLAIIGEGDERARLEEERDALGLFDDVLLPGWDDNPYRWMARASVMVLCSDWEGLPSVLIEAMACGTPVVSTNCPHGPREVLDNGRLGILVPVGDTEAMARAIEQTLDSPIDSKILVQSAQRYSIDASRQAFLSLAAGLLSPSCRPGSN